MFGAPTLLRFSQGIASDLEQWLGKLGLKEFLESYPIEQLIEWGWIRPEYRVIFPRIFFEKWEDYPYSPCPSSADLSDYSMLWDYRWSPEESDGPFWFLDPAFHPGGVLTKKLAESIRPAPGVVPPSAISLQSGREAYPYVDYFFRWQGYALIDVILSADCFHPVFRTPDMIKRAQETVRTAEYLSAHPSLGPTAVLESARKWGGLADIMTWLAHLRSFRDALYQNGEEVDAGELRARYEKGARELASHFDLHHDSLANIVEEKLLVLADSWMSYSKNPPRSPLRTEAAWEFLRDEIRLAITWLMLLGDNPFSYYIDRWTAPHFGSLGWAELREVLPYRFIEHDEKLARIVPHYLKSFNEIKNNNWTLDKNKIILLCRKIRRRNYPFGGFLASFYELHNSLSYKDFEKHGIDFRELRPLDHFAMLAIHAEGCMRRELDVLGVLNSLDGSNQTLSQYIQELAKIRGIPNRVIDFFSAKRHLADLKKDRTDPIGRIQSLTTKLSKKEHQLLQGLLCCLLARNYFAHHDFLDKELLQRTPLPAFLLRGILLAVLILLDDGGSDEELKIL